MKKLKITGALKPPHRTFLRVHIQTIELSENGFEYIIDEQIVEYELEER